MTGTITEILTVRGALVRALLSAERHYATATTKVLRVLYEQDIAAINRAIRILEGSESEVPAEVRERVDKMIDALRRQNGAATAPAIGAEVAQ